MGIFKRKKKDVQETATLLEVRKNDLDVSKPKTLPLIICAKVSEQFTEKKDDYQVLYLHTPNKFDKISTYHYYYYDFFGEEIPMNCIEEYIVLKEK